MAAVSRFLLELTESDDEFCALTERVRGGSRLALVGSNGWPREPNNGEGEKGCENEGASIADHSDASMELDENWMSNVPSQCSYINVLA
ncbi:MAG: hypothetical protein AAGD01_11620 [Acidobacteriota bacterium]